MDLAHGEIRQFERKFKDKIFKILKNKITTQFMQWSMEPSTDFEDCTLSYDMVFRGKVEISVRIRKNEYLRYKDFTIRSRSQNGHKCEIDKLKEGLGNLYFYAWMDQGENDLEHWIIVDINKIRNKLITEGIERSNKDMTKFRAYSIQFLRDNFAIIAEKGQMQLF